MSCFEIIEPLECPWCGKEIKYRSTYWNHVARCVYQREHEPSKVLRRAVSNFIENLEQEKRYAASKGI